MIWHDGDLVDQKGLVLVELDFAPPVVEVLAFQGVDLESGVVARREDGVRGLLEELVPTAWTVGTFRSCVIKKQTKTMSSIRRSKGYAGPRM